MVSTLTLATTIPVRRDRVAVDHVETGSMGKLEDRTLGVIHFVYPNNVVTRTGMVLSRARRAQ